MAEQDEIVGWPIEEIPNRDALFMRVHDTWFKPGGAIAPGAFQKRDGGMSTDWSQYSTPEQTRQRGRTPRDNAVVEMNVGRIRTIPGQRVEHRPFPDNRAHTDVLGEDDEEVRTVLRRFAEIVLPFPDGRSV